MLRGLACVSIWTNWSRRTRRNQCMSKNRCRPPILIPLMPPKRHCKEQKSVVGLRPERDLIVYFVHFRNELPDRFLNLGAYRRKLDTMLFLIAPNHSRGRLYRRCGGDVCATHLMGSAPDRLVAQ
jgi:hypothetical protein